MMLLIVAHALLGLIIGSFLNVFVLRHNTGRSLSGRSGCLVCRQQLTWKELVPVFSWVAQAGKCRSCSVRISVQYPLVEIGTGVLFAIVAGAFLPFAQHVLALGLVSLLIAITTYDIKHTIIPDSWVYSAAVLAFFIGALNVTPAYELLPWILHIASGPILASPLAALWFASRGAWMGLGDAKLVLIFGWLLGLSQGFFALTLAFIFGALGGLFLLFVLPFTASVMHGFRGARLRRVPTRFTMKSEIPFGPFLVAALLLLWFTQLYGFSLHLPLF